MIDPTFAEAREVLARAIAARATPGAQLCVQFRQGNSWHSWQHCDGALSYDDDAPRVSMSTRYDLASLTKVFVASAALVASARGALDLDAPLASVVPEARGTYAGERSLRALATHRADLPAFLPWFRDVDPRDAGRADVRARVLDAVARTPREPTDGAERYSDVGYILLGEAVAHSTHTSLDRAVANDVLAPSGLDRAIAFRTVFPAEDDGTIAPTEGCAWRGRVVQGQVHDENAYALGGTAGHAGLFGDAASVAEFGRATLDALAGRGAWLDATTLRAALRPLPGGTHRFGWDGVAAQNSSAGALASRETFGHLGFTGTSLWCDPARSIVVALLTNRVHPTRENIQIRALRPALHDAVFRALTA